MPSTINGLARSRELSGGDTSSAIQVVLDSLQSYNGRVRLTTQGGNVHEVAALTKLAASPSVIGSAAAAIVAGADSAIGLRVTGLTATSTWGQAVTAIAAS